MGEYCLYSKKYGPRYFDKLTRYNEQQPVYFVLQETRFFHDTVVCRELIPGVEDASTFDDVYYFSEPIIENAIEINENFFTVPEKPCLLLYKVKSLDDADRAIKTYQKGLKLIEELKGSEYLNDASNYRKAKRSR